MALSAPPRPLANARDKDRAPGHAAARGAASPSRGSHQLVSLGCVENLGMSKTRPAPTGQFGCVENFEPRPRVYRRLASLPGRAVVVRLLPPSPSPSTGERRRPSVWAGWPAPTTPPPPRLGGPQPRAEATGTSEGGRQDAPAVGPSAWPGASRLVIPLPARPLRLARRRSQPPSRAPLARWLLASLYTLRPHLGGEMPSKPSSVPKFVLGHSLTM